MNFKTKKQRSSCYATDTPNFFTKSPKTTHLNHSLLMGRSIWEYLSHYLGHIWKEVVCIFAFIFLSADSRLIPLAAFLSRCVCVALKTIVYIGSLLFLYLLFFLRWLCVCVAFLVLLTVEYPKPHTIPIPIIHPLIPTVLPYWDRYKRPLGQPNSNNT
jgi:hypothetical protein